MSMELANERESLGQFATNKGYTQLIRAAKPYPALNQFFREGATKDIAGCRSELAALAKVSGSEVADTARALSSLMDGQKVAVVTSGEANESAGETAPPKPPPRPQAAPVSPRRNTGPQIRFRHSGQDTRILGVGKRGGRWGHGL